MALMSCRKCHAEITPEVAECPKCGVKAPFNCAACGAEIGDIQQIGGTFPFDQDGKPLCSQHARSLCDKCRRPFPREELKLRVLHWERINEGQPLIPINGAFLPGVQRKAH